MGPHDTTSLPATTSRPGNGPRGRRWAHPIASRRASRRETIISEYHAELGRAGQRAQADLVRAGYHLGPVPFGYRALPVPILDGAGRAHLRRRLHRDPVTAPTITLIFHLRACQFRSYALIAHQLITAALTPQGNGTDRSRLWTPDSVRRIVTNPVYMGWQVWGRTSGGRRADPAQWVVCVDAHEPLVSELVFTHAQNLPGAQATFLLPAIRRAGPDIPSQIVAELP
ncbi:Recombinase [Parafrankia irregularis]|uniref:Recombinase n=1 Tax=Parafrankia irregularis TaxID=795642 RepID=A0A0S4QNJ3_9ACTN|nr:MULTISPECIES: recombinase family protein [Parafrankia]MBE3200212.1 recombinase family protein [Parafrankia sp. CH37]CUU56594.1 Recombinase [Parafrankia irregularis]